MDTFSLQTLVSPWLVFLADDPVLRVVQGGMIGFGLLLVFLVFYATRDILLRTTSLVRMFLSILLVTALPGIGFLLYLLVRPTTTLRERAMEHAVWEILEKLEKQMSKPSVPHHHHERSEQKHKSKPKPANPPVLIALFVSLAVFALIERSLPLKILYMYQILSVLLFGSYLIARSWLLLPTFELRFSQFLAIIALLGTIVYVVIHRRRYPHL